MSDITIRTATLDDLGAVVGLSVNGDASASLALPEHYLAAFEAISADANNELIVADMNDEIVGTLQLTFVPGLSYEGGVRVHVEGVVVSSKHRNRGIGTQLMKHVISDARQRGCCLVQLMAPKWRSEVHRFYQKLGFSLTHEGAKLELQ